MSAWSFVDPVGATAPKVGVHCGMRKYKGSTWVLVLRLFPDVSSELDLSGTECFRVAVPAGEQVNRIRLLEDRTGPFQAKEAARGSAINLSVTGLEPVDPDGWKSTSIEWKIVERDQLELALPAKVMRVRKG